MVIPEIAVKRVTFLRAEGPRWDDGCLARWWRRMGNEWFSCSPVTHHCCPFTVSIGDACFGLHPWVQWAASEEHGILTQTIHRHCFLGHTRVAYGPPGLSKFDHCEGRYAKDGDVKFDHWQAGHCTVGHASGALVQVAAGPDRSADLPNGMLISPDATRRTRKITERREEEGWLQPLVLKHADAPDVQDGEVFHLAADCLLAVWPGPLCGSCGFSPTCVLRPGLWRCPITALAELGYEQGPTCGCGPVCGSALSPLCGCSPRPAETLKLNPPPIIPQLMDD